MESTASMTYEPNLPSPLMQTNTVNTGTHFYSTWEVLYNNFYNEASTVLSLPTTEVDYQKLEVAESERNIQIRKMKNEEKSLKRRLRKGRPTESKKDLCKKARNSGKPYEKLKGKDKGCYVGEKEVGPSCDCPSKCFKKIGDDIIQKIFRDFWALGDYNSQNAYLFGLINLTSVKRRYTKNETSRRNYTISYSVKKKGQNVLVCKKAFLNIHGLQRNRGRINNLANKMKEGESVPPPDRRGRHSNRPNAYSEEAIDHVRNHLRLCPKVGRKNNKPTKQMELSTKRCYEMYAYVYCKEQNIEPVSLDKYRRIYWEEGYRTAQPFPKRSVNEDKTNSTVNTLGCDIGLS